ncbi:MAG TPA: hypothetical protein PK784_04550 [Tenuifilaceae bacterium]|nr:hypothetical protein [Tenuifilaceae bacterium]
MLKRIEKISIEMNTEPKIYQEGNPWQNKVYLHMSAYLETKGVVSFGQSVNGNTFKHLLTEEQSEYNFITKEIHTATLNRFKDHKAGDLKRILTNTAASQPYCFNLIIYLQQHLELANKLFSVLLNKQVKVIHLEPEFTPNTCNDIEGFKMGMDESIGDQAGNKGTDADIAVFYTYENNKKGLILIEFKFIEAEFSTCSSYREKGQIRNVCDSSTYFEDLVVQKKRDSFKNYICGYNKYLNWQLTKESMVLDIKTINSSSHCPFRFGLNQLWRNMILAERVASTRNYDEFGFWVFSPSENDKYLWKNGETESQFRAILTKQGNDFFRKVHLESIFEILHEIVSEEKDRYWLNKMEERYRI